MLSRLIASAANTAPYEPPYWDISRITPVFAQLKDIGAQETRPLDIKFRPDGQRMYLLGDAVNDITTYYFSGAAWDVTSLVAYASVLSVSAYAGTIPSGICISDDGTILYVLANSLSRILQFTSTEAWIFNSSTTTYTGFYNYGAIFGFPDYMEGLFFKPGGTKMYVLGYANIGTNCYLSEVTLSTAWDVTSYSSFISQSITTPTGLRPRGLAMSPTGDTIFIVDAVTADVYQYALSTPWDVTTLSYVQDFTGTITGTDIRGLTARPEGTAFFYVEQGNDRVYAYGLGNPWSIAREDRKSVLSQDSSPIDIFFKPDGTRMYMLGSVGDDLNEYNLSTAWDITTATYNNKSTALADLTPLGVFFKPDGTKFFIVGATGDSIYEYTMTTAWNIGAGYSLTASYNVSAEDTSPTAVAFNSDGTKMFVTGQIGDDINEYSLSSGWDLSSTITYVRSVSVYLDVLNPWALVFSPDGFNLFVSNTTSIVRYTLSTAFDITTLTKVSTIPTFTKTGMRFDEIGSALYTIDASTDSVRRYNLF
jgi:6-phosphogluconolactonase (cycloisomerase 2 family)